LRIVIFQYVFLKLINFYFSSCLYSDSIIFHTKNHHSKVELYIDLIKLYKITFCTFLND